jgi:hypothetical protein
MFDAPGWVAVSLVRPESAHKPTAVVQVWVSCVGREDCAAECGVSTPVHLPFLQHVCCCRMSVHLVKGVKDKAKSKLTAELIPRGHQQSLGTDNGCLRYSLQHTLAVLLTYRCCALSEPEGSPPVQKQDCLTLAQPLVWLRKLCCTSTIDSLQNPQNLVSRIASRQSLLVLDLSINAQKAQKVSHISTA